MLESTSPSDVFLKIQYSKWTRIDKWVCLIRYFQMECTSKSIGDMGRQVQLKPVYFFQKKKNCLSEYFFGLVFKFPFQMQHCPICRDIIWGLGRQVINLVLVNLVKKFWESKQQTQTHLNRVEAVKSSSSCIDDVLYGVFVFISCFLGSHRWQKRLFEVMYIALNILERFDVFGDNN